MFPGEGKESTYVIHGYSEIVAPAWLDLGCLICLRHLFCSKAIANRVFLSEKTYFCPCYVKVVFSRNVIIYFEILP